MNAHKIRELVNESDFKRQIKDAYSRITRFTESGWEHSEKRIFNEIRKALS